MKDQTITLGQILQVLGPIIGVLITTYGVVRIKRLEQSPRALTPYEHLAGRVLQLEVADENKTKQIDHLRSDLGAVIIDRDGVVQYLKVFWRWALDGAVPPPPAIPDHLHDVLPPNEYRWPMPDAVSNTPSAISQIVVGGSNR